LSSVDAERALLAERVLAEQEERRRLAELLHDGPIQQLAAIAQILDSALEAVRSGESQRAEELVSRGLELTRKARREVRALGEDLEPRVLRELGFATALDALARRYSARHGVTIQLAVEYANELGEHAQTALYQIAREAIDQAVRRGAPTIIEVSLLPVPGGGAEMFVSDDGPPERRAAVLESLAERAASLNARFSSEVRYPRGSTIRIELPPSAAAR
jgi:two-component system, NarL family, sensor kinase